MSARNVLRLGGAALGVALATPAAALSIVSGTAGWNTDNVVVGASVIGTTDSSASTVYDRDVTGGTAGAVTNGRVAYGGGESQEPGIKVMNGADQGGFPTIPEYDTSLNASNCIMASSYTYCDGPRQSGKRFKQQMTGLGATDLVFNVDATDPTENRYRVFQRLVNQTTFNLAGFVLELGFGVGADFVVSSIGDGLSLAPRDAQSATQFPFGLFGAPEVDRPLGGFFDATERALFDSNFSEDSITTTGLLGSYDDYFPKGWRSQEQAPDGVLFDHDDDAGTDALVMAFLNEQTGKWELRRTIVAGEVVTLEADPAVRGAEFNSSADVITALGLLGGDTGLMEVAPIEDVANLNVNYYIDLANAVLWPTFDLGDSSATFTVRVTPEQAVVPLPAAAPMLLAGLGGLTFLRRRRSARQAA